MFNALVVAVAVTSSDRATRAARSLAGRAGLPVETLVVPEGGDVAAAIVEHVRARDGALLVMNTGGTYLLSRARRSVASDVLERLCQPVLLLGPHWSQQLGASRVLVGVDRAGERQPAIQVADEWRRTFCRDPTDRRRRRVELARGVRRRGHRRTRPRHGAAYERPGDGARSARRDRRRRALRPHERSLPGGRSHWYPTTRRVVQTTTRPVLVVPSDLPS